MPNHHTPPCLRPDRHPRPGHHPRAVTNTAPRRPCPVAWLLVCVLCPIAVPSSQPRVVPAFVPLSMPAIRACPCCACHASARRVHSRVRRSSPCRCPAQPCTVSIMSGPAPVPVHMRHPVGPGLCLCVIHPGSRLSPRHRLRLSSTPASPFTPGTRRLRPAFRLYLVRCRLHMYCAVCWSCRPSSMLRPITSRPRPASSPASSSVHASAASCIPAPEKTTGPTGHAFQPPPVAWPSACATLFVPAVSRWHARPSTTFVSHTHDRALHTAPCCPGPRTAVLRPRRPSSPMAPRVPAAPDMYPCAHQSAPCQPATHDRPADRYISNFRPTGPADTH